MACTVLHSWHLIIMAYLACAKGSDPDVDECANFKVPGCSCAYLGLIYGIICNNETNILTLPRTLDSIFEVNNTYEITLENFSSVPSHVIQGLIVFRFIVDDPVTVEISESAFHGVIRLRWFHVYRSSLSNIPDLTVATHSLRKVNIDNSLLRKVQGEFQDLPLLVRLSLRNNTIESIHADAFKGSTAIAYLDLSYNRLASLPENIFDELKDIIKLALSYNRLHTVYGLFKNLSPQLKFLNLEFNNLINASEVLSQPMPKLESLSLNNNPLRKLDTTTFNGTVPKLRFLSLDHCNLTEFRVDVFKHLQILSSLDLCDNHIKHIGDGIMDFGYNFDLILSGNQIESFAGGITYRTKGLFVTDNNLRHLGTLLQFTQLSELDLSRNRLVALEQQDFFGSHGTEYISFRDNEVERIDAQCFDAFRNDIHTLDLSNNKLISLNRSVQYMSQLKILNVSFNFLETLDDEEFIGLNELTDLYIQNNNIVVLKSQIQTIPNLQYLILESNPITSLDINQIPRSLLYLNIKG